MKNVKSKWPFLKIKVGFCPKNLGVKSKKWSKKVNVKSKWPKTHFYLLFKCDKKYKNIYKYEKKVGIWPIRLHIYFLGYFCLLSLKSKIFAKNRVWRIKVYEIL